MRIFQNSTKGVTNFILFPQAFPSIGVSNVNKLTIWEKQSKFLDPQRIAVIALKLE